MKNQKKELATKPEINNMNDMNALKNIRKNIFNLTQAEFAAIAGVGQATVCRWETGGYPPSLNELQAIRSAAKERNIKWNDEWFYSIPEKV
jgi:DNA-binding transcriptional regulator YiaG